MAEPRGPAPTRGIQRLVLLGAGHAHVQVLAHLANHQRADLQVTLVSPYAHQTYSGMTPGLVAGCYTEAQGQIPLAPLVQAAGARWLRARCTRIDSAQQQVHLAPAPGTTEAPAPLSYDWLSIDTGGVLERDRIEARMPGVSEHALWVRPIEAFVQLWPQVVQLARERCVSLAVIGAGAAGVELVFAAEQRLRQEGLRGSRCTLITGGPDLLASHPVGVQARARRLLRQRGIDVIREACVGVAAGGIQLSNGATLVCDVPLLAIGTHAPSWLADSGLALGPDGHVRVNRFQQSSSHANVFAAGDVSERDDHPHPRNGVYAVRAGPALAHNLLAVHAGQPLKPHWPPQNTLNLISCGSGYAIASWGPLHTEGRWVWRWKDRIDRGFIARYLRAPGTLVQQPS